MPPSGPEPGTPAVADPVARVLVDVALPHLDRPFDYQVRADQAAHAVPGARVRVRFAGRLTNGFVLERGATTEHLGELAPIERVVSAEPVLTPQIAELSRRVAEHYAGTRSDVLRLAIPPRHARTEQAPAAPPGERSVAVPEPGEWRRYPDGPALLDSLARAGRPRAVVSALPGLGWAELVARAAQATLTSGRGAVLVAPGTADVARIDAALTELLGPDQHVALHAEQGPSARYRRFLSLLRGRVQVVVGTRSAVFAPVRALGLIAVWDDGDDLLAEPRAPYPHARDVALLRAHQEHCGLILAGHARTAEAARLLETGWAHEVRAERPTTRAAAPRVVASDARRPSGRSPATRLPDEVFHTVRSALTRGPVLVQVPLRGYRPSLTCQDCRTPARCARCGGPLAQPHADQPPVCRWCATPDPGWSCPNCSSTRLRAAGVGDERTAEELGRAFPGTPVRQSGQGRVVSSVPDGPALVVCTPGAEPAALGGYSAGVILDAAVTVGRADLRATEEALRRWMNAAALVRSAAADGTVVLVGDPAQRAVQALVRWDPAGFAERELADRVSAQLPPSWRLAELTGSAAAVDDLLELATLPDSCEVLGPVPSDAADDSDAVRAVVRAPLPDGLALSRALRAAAAVRSARRSAGVVRIRVDPVDLG